MRHCEAARAGARTVRHISPSARVVRRELLVRGDFRNDSPDVLHERIQRRLREAFDVSMRRVVESIGFRRRGTNTVRLNALRAELRLITCTGGHGRKNSRSWINCGG